MASQYEKLKEHLGKTHEAYGEVAKTRGEAERIKRYRKAYELHNSFIAKVSEWMGDVEQLKGLDYGRSSQAILKKLGYRNSFEGIRRNLPKDPDRYETAFDMVRGVAEKHLAKMKNGLAKTAGLGIIHQERYAVGLLHDVYNVRVEAASRRKMSEKEIQESLKRALDAKKLITEIGSTSVEHLPPENKTRKDIEELARSSVKRIEDLSFVAQDFYEKRNEIDGMLNHIQELREEDEERKIESKSLTLIMEDEAPNVIDAINKAKAEIIGRKLEEPIQTPCLESLNDRLERLRKITRPVQEKKRK